MTYRATLVAAATVVTLASPAAALVLCEAPSGSITLRAACQPTEIQLDSAAVADALPCPPDAMKVGPTCVDKYEASIWQIPPDQPQLVEQVKTGTATADDLHAGGAEEVAGSDACHCDPLCKDLMQFPSTFPNTGNWTAPLHAASVAGVAPAVCVTWFQAEQACALSGKRLLTNQEWQRAAAGTPDGAPCVVSGGAMKTGANPGCVSTFGIFDMVGNVWEWVGDWGDMTEQCTNWPSAFGSDASCVGGPGGSGYLGYPGARHRGGDYEPANAPGVFAISDGMAKFTAGAPSYSSSAIGFRCGR